MLSDPVLIGFLQSDLAQERKHLTFYANAGATVAGLHREELSEFFLKEAASELQHVIEFSQMIVRLGGTPCPAMIVDIPSHLYACQDPKALIAYAAQMEQEVAENYTKRLHQTESIGEPDKMAVHLFYERQLEDSWAASRELQLMIKE